MPTWLYIRHEEVCYILHVQVLACLRPCIQPRMLQAAVSSPEKPQSPIKDTKAACKLLVGVWGLLCPARASKFSGSAFCFCIVYASLSGDRAPSTLSIESPSPPAPAKESESPAIAAEPVSQRPGVDRRMGLSTAYTAHCKLQNSTALSSQTFRMSWSLGPVAKELYEE